MVHLKRGFVLASEMIGLTLSNFLEAFLSFLGLTLTESLASSREILSFFLGRLESSREASSWAEILTSTIESAGSETGDFSMGMLKTISLKKISEGEW